MLSVFVWCVEGCEVESVLLGQVFLCFSLSSFAFVVRPI